MKYFFTFATLTLFFLTSTCNNQNPESAASMQITGTIEPIGMTTWQYGSHTIGNEEGKLYALRSEKLNLAEYEGNKVTITGKKVEGYPVENGPEFIEVTKIKQ